MIDEALAEIDQVEAEVEEMIGELLGPQVAARVKAFGEVQRKNVPLRLPKGAKEKEARPGASPGSSEAPPETR